MPAVAELFDQVGVSFFDDHESIHFLGETPDPLQRQREGEPELQQASLRRGFAHVHRGDARSDDPQGGIPFENPVGAALLIPLGDLGELLPQSAVGRPGVGRDHHSAGDIVIEMRRGIDGLDGTGADHGLRVAHTRGHAEEDGQRPASGDVECGQQVVVGLLGIGRLEHGHAGGYGVAAVVLFVLAGGHARIIGGDDDQRARRAGIGGGEEGIGGDVQSDVLHGDQGRGRGHCHT